MWLYCAAQAATRTTLDRIEGPRGAPRRYDLVHRERESALHALGAAAGVALDLAVGVPLGQRLPLVVLLLAAAETEFDLGPTVDEVHRQRNQRVSAFADLAGELVDLLPVQQQLAGRRGAWLVQVPSKYSAMCTLRSQTSSSETVAKPSTSEARPARNDFTSVPVSEIPASTCLEDRVVVTRLAIRRNRLASGVFGIGSHSLSRVSVLATRYPRPALPWGQLRQSWPILGQRRPAGVAWWPDVVRGARIHKPESTGVSPQHRATSGRGGRLGATRIQQRRTSAAPDSGRAAATERPSGYNRTYSRSVT